MIKLLASVGSFVRTLATDQSDPSQSHNVAPEVVKRADQPSKDLSAEVINGFSEHVSFPAPEQELHVEQIEAPKESSEVCAQWPVHVRNRAEALITVCGRSVRDPRTSQQIAIAADVAIADVYHVLHHGNLPSDSLLLKLCAAFNVRLDTEIDPKRSSSHFDELPPLSLRSTRVYAKQRRVKIACDRQQAVDLICVRLNQDKRSIADIAIAAGVGRAGIRKLLRDGKMPSGPLLLALCREFQIKLDITQDAKIEMLSRGHPNGHKANGQLDRIREAAAALAERGEVNAKTALEHPQNPIDAASHH